MNYLVFGWTVLLQSFDLWCHLAPVFLSLGFFQLTCLCWGLSVALHTPVFILWNCGSCNGQEVKRSNEKARHSSLPLLLLECVGCWWWHLHWYQTPVSPIFQYQYQSLPRELQAFSASQGLLRHPASRNEQLSSSQPLKYAHGIFWSN